MPNCSVCSNPLASYHFGAIVCRACAIFFRRFVFRKKEKVYCNCFLKRDKKTIFYNFIIKWNILELSILSKKFNDPTQLFSPSGAVATTVEDFYSAGNSKISKNEIRDIFEPFWNYRYFNVNRPLLEMKFGDVQNMALFGILLWDPGYTNLSETLAETCHTMRKIIFRELNSFLDNSGTFFYTLEALNLIERAEQKCREEIHLCGIHNIEFDQERKNMILWDK
ncbi:Protein CBG18608 [Caenorhabditis briggsae]|uniref:Protein CBG18608 n=1 Tax=Caenorhabditis briggsae TaxID=6238 RepID=A8XTP9_CAEBR|nr:Protein CBG18608 [Caenorhabditis briggsae]CAP36025.2 Protein CBG18608 [Caenorhabditis briggsae]